MSQENVEAVKRVEGAGNRRDVEAVLAELDGAVFDFENGKAIRVRTYVGAKALKAVGLRD